MKALLTLSVIAAAMLTSFAPATSAASRAEPAQVALVKDWALARCLYGADPDGALGRDAATSATVYLERGKIPVEAYQASEPLIARALARRVGGSVPGEYKVLKCIEMYRSPALDAVARAAGRRKPN